MLQLYRECSQPYTVVASLRSQFPLLNVNRSLIVYSVDAHTARFPPRKLVHNITPEREYNIIYWFTVPVVNFKKKTFGRRRVRARALYMYYKVRPGGSALRGEARRRRVVENRKRFELIRLTII